MLPIYPASAVALLLTLATAQQSQPIISPTLPICAQQCPILLQAQGGCVPPAAPATNEAQYQSCFCLSAFLTTLPSNPAAICPACSPADLGTLEAWFTDLCKPGGQPNAIPAPTTSPRSTTGSVATATPKPTTNNAAGGSTISTKPASDNRTWMATHWRWVLMLIILFIGFALLAWAFRYFHRRYHRLHDGEAMVGVPRPPDLGTWGPGHSAHDFGAAAFPGIRPPVDEKGKGVAGPESGGPTVRPEVGQRQQSLENPKRSRRLKKSWLPGKG